ncbi:DUF3958 family protein [Candidatus Enterococcus mansonii]|uniref:Uncharacterized protein n=1 Tax=Candidatus Enterococcus mansonii TaxID=1834181 RepID=A0A242CE69_9ENTE|nr:DUF3958 family protein [Enterococcus sp. 4G2_DIV0659]OTO08535.1 hypothetical protein A5880_001535 [Enterococcus sp. 4G2_DIV0659]
MTEPDYKVQLSKIQDEQNSVKKELKSIEKQREDFFYLNQQEQRIYAELIATSDPEDRRFFQDKGEDSFFQSKRAQQQLEKNEEQLQRVKKELADSEEETYQLQRKSLLKKEED